MSDSTQDHQRPFDFLDPEFNAHFYETLDDLRRHCPVAHATQHGWSFLSRYEDVRRVLLDWETFSSAGPLGIAGRDIGPRLIPIDLDPPLHQEWRQLLNPYFTPAAMAPLAPAVGSISDRLIDSFIESGACEFVGDFALRFPGEVFFSQVLHLPSEDVARCQQWIERGVKGRHDPAGAAAAFQALNGYVTELVEHAQRAPRSDDVVSAVVGASIGGTAVSTEDQVSAITMLILGGLETTSNLLGSSVHFLASHPAELERLKADVSLRSTATEELLRYFAPTVWLGRTATASTTIGDHEVREGDYLLVSYAAANRDDTEFPDAHEFVATRDPNRHLAFGLGRHRCIGSHLARLMFSTAIDRVLDRLIDLKIDARAEVHFHTSHVRGVEHLPLTFTPGARVAMVSAGDVGPS